MSERQRYQVIERIAAGGMAEVYRGESAGIEGFRKKVAIKRVLPKLSENREFINMFLDEARLCAYLSHSRCVQVFDIGQGAGSHFIVMEYVDGADLKEVIEHWSARGRLLPIEVACSVALQVCEGLAYAHNAVDHAGRPLNIVHRDISPHNVLITRFGEVKLVDFGLAKAGSHLTAEDEDIVKGKFGYLAPEVTLGKGADHRVDLFAAGILLWEMLANRRLFLGSSDLETFKQVQAAKIPDIRTLRKDANDDVFYVLSKALAREPAQRYQSADEFARDLSLVLLRYGRPVTYQDIAKIVQETANERARKQRAERHSVDDFLGDVIIDTLHEFSYAGGDVDTADDRPSRLGTPGLENHESDFIDPSTWALDDSLGDFLSPAQPGAAPNAPPSSRKAPPQASPTSRTVAHRHPPPLPASRNAGASTAAQISTPTEAPSDDKAGGAWWRRWWNT